ncbi:glycosyltransferase, partial [Desulfovibrio sp. OttesenSCG-928-G11]|nr:glycosyltransferase [Desulfovibrio sp. OttesenSCG-928-G11]
RLLSKRRNFLDMLFRAARGTEMRINAFDRNYNRFSRFFAFRFPNTPELIVHPQVSYPETAHIYKTHAVSINVNSVVDSETMCSRRLLEILACGGIVLTNASLCVTKHFKEFCHVVSTEDEARAFFLRMKSGPSIQDREKAEAGAQHVRSAHTWQHRMQTICAVANI